MAKQQTFGDKLKKKKEEQPVVRVIKWYRDEDRGSLRKMSKFVKVKDLNEVTNLDVTKG